MVGQDRSHWEGEINGDPGKRLPGVSWGAQGAERKPMWLQQRQQQGELGEVRSEGEQRQILQALGGQHKKSRLNYEWSGNHCRVLSSWVAGSGLIFKEDLLLIIKYLKILSLNILHNLCYIYESQFPFLLSE